MFLVLIFSFSSGFVLAQTSIDGIWPLAEVEFPHEGSRPQPGANQRVVLTAGAGVNPEPLGRIS